MINLKFPYFPEGLYSDRSDVDLAKADLDKNQHLIRELDEKPQVLIDWCALSLDEFDWLVGRFYALGGSIKMMKCCFLTLEDSAAAKMK